MPTAKIESVRFRSVPFQNPTSKLPGSDDEDSSPSKSKATKKAPHPSSSGEKPTNHSTNRAQTWRSSSKNDKDEDTIKQDEKTFLTPNQKKKIAFINHQFHTTADTVHAYVVFAHPPPPESTVERAKNVPPPPPVMDPYEAAKLAVEKCNNTVFMERVIRVDRVGSKAKLPGGLEGDGALGEAGIGALGDADPKYTIFVGNLDFASKEEDLRAFFESLVVKEKGPPPPASKDGMEVDGEDSRKSQHSSWVVRVRIVRDKETQLGKGFAYVQFSVRSSLFPAACRVEPPTKCIFIVGQGMRG